MPVFTWTETPMVEMWRHLRYLRSPLNVLKLLCGKIKSNREEKWSESEELRKRSYEIAACIRQADEYYQSAETVGLATHPLLQFYGALALAKAVILSNDPNLWLSDLKYHGLSSRASSADKNHREILQEYSNNSSLWELEREFAIAIGGVFPSLCRSIKDNSPTKGAILTFKDLIRCVPDLAEVFKRHYDEPSHCFYLSGEPTRDAQGRLEILFNARDSLEDIRRVFPEFDDSFEELRMPSHCGFRSLEAREICKISGRIEKGTVAGEYLVRPLDCGIHKSLSILYASLFILSNVVRYKPAFWMQLIEGEKSGSSSIAEALCNRAKRRLPNDVLEAIWKEGFVYGTPGYLS
jgi:hypothetical protein